MGLNQKLIQNGDDSLFGQTITYLSEAFRATLPSNGTYEAHCSVFKPALTLSVASIQLF